MNQSITSLFIIAALLTAGCGKKWESVELDGGTQINDILSLDLYSPYDREILFEDPESKYGPPRESGSQSKKGDYVYYSEYVGKHGRIRIYDEVFIHEEGSEDYEWIVLSVGGLYLNDVIKAKYLSQVQTHEDEWNLSFYPPDHSWTLTLHLEGSAVTQIVDLPK